MLVEDDGDGAVVVETTLAGVVALGVVGATVTFVALVVLLMVGAAVVVVVVVSVVFVDAGVVVEFDGLRLGSLVVSDAIP